MALKLSDTMLNELRYAAQEGYQGEVVYAGRKTVDALFRRGLITRDYDNATFATGKWGYRNPVLTVAGWAVIGERPADQGRLSFEDAWEEAHPKADDAPVCICPVRTDYPNLDCMTFRAAHSVTDTEENNDVTIKEGPLTERQIHILNHLRAGKRHEEIAKAWATVPGGGEEPRTITVSVVKQECMNIAAKFGTATVTQAVSLWATAQAYRASATLIGHHRSERVDNEVDAHVDHVLSGLIRILRERADLLTPQ